jgi:hypothetical protein
VDLGAWERAEYDTGVSSCGSWSHVGFGVGEPVSRKNRFLRATDGSGVDMEPETVERE